MKSEERNVGFAIVVIVIISICIWVGCSYLEARAYNNVTGQDVSTWDAMFLDLRVQEGVAPKDKD